MLQLGRCRRPKRTEEESQSLRNGAPTYTMCPGLLFWGWQSRREKSLVHLPDFGHTDFASRAVFLLPAAIILGVGLEASVLQAQDRAFQSLPLRSIGPDAPSPSALASGGLPPRSRALLGSTIGVGVGVPLGVLLIQASRSESAEFGGDDEPGARLGAGLLGAVALIGGGPIGAVQALGGGEATTYAGAVVGELLLGGAGLALGSALGSRSDSRRAWSLALGMPLAAVGAAGGAILESDGETPHRSAAVARTHDGAWRIRVPDVQIAPVLQGKGTVSAQTTLVRIRF